jgi:hypothetical protein
MEVPCAGGAPQGATCAEAADASPRLSDSARTMLHELVVHDAGAGVPGNAALGDVASAPGSSSTMSLGLSGLYLPGSPGAPAPPINWRWVEDEADFACLQVAAAERLLQEMLASVHQNILRLVQVSLKRENLDRIPMASFMLSHFFYVLFP